MTRRLAVIPARGGSKRVPRKNIRMFHGKPIMVHVLEAARESGVFDEIHVSTEDAEIAAIASRHGFEPAFLRPVTLADDETPIMPVLRNVLETYSRAGQEFDTVALLYATAVLIEGRDIAAACHAYENGDRAISLISVSRYPAPVEWAMRMGADGMLSPVSPGAFAIPSQELGEAYFDSASFVFFSSGNIFASQGAGSDANFRAYELPQWKATDIDTPEDWAVAEQVYSAFRAGNG